MIAENAGGNAGDLSPWLCPGCGADMFKITSGSADGLLHATCAGCGQASVPGGQESAEALHRISHQVAHMFNEWQRYAPVVSAFSGGGLLAARRAARNGG